jgi:hypothetical protein
MRCGARSDALGRHRRFGRAGRLRTRRSPRCPSRSAACPSSPHCASAGRLRAWVRHWFIGAHRSGRRLDARVWRFTPWCGRAGRSRARRSPCCPSRSAACPISAHCASVGHLRTGLWLVVVAHRSGRMRRDAVRHAIGCAGVASWCGRAGRSRARRSPRCPSRSAACPISAHCASADNARVTVAALVRGHRQERSPTLRCRASSNGLALRRGVPVQVYHEHTNRRLARVVRQPVQARHTVRLPALVRGCGTCASARHGTGLDAVRHAIGCACAMSWVRPCRVIESTPIGALPESLGRLSNLYNLCVRRAPASVAAALARRRSLESAGLWLDAVWRAIGCARAASWVRPCRTIEDTPIGTLPESLGSLSDLLFLCVRRAPAHVAAALARGRSLESAGL